MNLKHKYFTLLRRHLDANTDLLVDGQVDSQEKYNRICGEIAGLRLAMREFDEMLDGMVEEVEEQVED